jgi:hypothetical protein
MHKRMFPTGPGYVPNVGEIAIDATSPERGNTAGGARDPPGPRPAKALLDGISRTFPGKTNMDLERIV